MATVPLGLNNRGHIVGVYLDGDGVEHGYVLRRGHFTTIEVPGAAGANAFGINDRGQIVGVYSNVPAPSMPNAVSANPGGYRRLSVSEVDPVRRTGWLCGDAEVGEVGEVVVGGPQALRRLST